MVPGVATMVAGEHLESRSGFRISRETLLAQDFPHVPRSFHTKAPFYGIYVCLLDDSSAPLPPPMVPVSNAGGRPSLTTEPCSPDSPEEAVSSGERVIQTEVHCTDFPT